MRKLIMVLAMLLIGGLMGSTMSNRAVAFEPGAIAAAPQANMSLTPVHGFYHKGRYCWKKRYRVRIRYCRSWYYSYGYRKCRYYGYKYRYRYRWYNCHAHGGYVY